MTPYETLLTRCGKEKLQKRLEAFCLESNKIEGEEMYGESDMQALRVILDSSTITEQVLFDAHKLYATGAMDLKPEEKGAYRTVQVYVGRYVPPAATVVKKLMDDYLLFYNHDRFANAFVLHVQFEKIHPFIDFNGRMGRALWLRTAIEKGYDCSLGFLHKFYYETLANFE